MSLDILPDDVRYLLFLDLAASITARQTISEVEASVKALRGKRALAATSKHTNSVFQSRKQYLLPLAL